MDVTGKWQLPGVWSSNPMVFFLASESWAPGTFSAPCHVAPGEMGPIGHQGAGNSSLKPEDGQQTTLGCLSPLHCVILGPSHLNKMKISGLQGTEMGQMVFTHSLSSVPNPLLPGMHSNILSRLAWRRDSSIVWQVLGQTLVLFLRWARWGRGCKGTGAPSPQPGPFWEFPGCPSSQCGKAMLVNIYTSTSHRLHAQSQHVVTHCLPLPHKAPLFPHVGGEHASVIIVQRPSHELVAKSIEWMRRTRLTVLCLPVGTSGYRKTQPLIPASTLTPALKGKALQRWKSFVKGNYFSAEGVDLLLWFYLNPYVANQL